MKVQINVPDSLNDITLEQYQKFEKLNTEENKNSSFLLQKIAALFKNDLLVSNTSIVIFSNATKIFSVIVLFLTLS